MATQLPRQTIGIEAIELDILAVIVSAVAAGLAGPAGSIDWTPANSIPNLYACTSWSHCFDHSDACFLKVSTLMEASIGNCVNLLALVSKDKWQAQHMKLAAANSAMGDSNEHLIILRGW